MSLIKKLFWPKKDYIKIFERFDDENSLNEFFEVVNKKGGRILEVNGVAYPELFSNYTEVGGFSGEYENLMSSKVNKKTIVHYRAPKKIDYILYAEKELQKQEEKDRKKMESRYSLRSLKKMLKEYNNSLPTNENSYVEKIPGENEKSAEEDYNPFGDDLPF